MLNAIQSPYKAPHVYIICAIDVVYIGETQKHPAIRWGQHLESIDGFRARLAEKGNPELDYLNNTKMLSVQCDWIVDHFTEAQWKMATQAVEHALHELFAADPRVLGKPLKLISDTEKTAPRNFKRWDLAHAFAREVIGDLSAVLRKSLNLPEVLGPHRLSQAWIR